MTIPIANPDISEEAKQRVNEVLDSGLLADGPQVRKFEDEFADYCGVDHAIATANGTTALHAALEGLGIGEGDTVLTTPFSFIATANAIRFTGAKPVFVDIDPETYNMDPTVVSATARKHNVDAIMPVHLYGLPAAMDPIREVADDLGVPVIEDAAQAHGATYNDELVGSLGDVSCFSFYPTKNMTTGEGGMILTDHAEVADAAARFVNHGRTDSYEHAEVGHNFRMTSIAAAIGRSQLNRLPKFIQRRQRNASQLTEGLVETELITPVTPEDRTHAYHQYTVRTSSRNDLQKHLDEHDIGYGVYYPRCIHNQPAYERVQAEAPSAETAAKEVLSLPVHPNVSRTDINEIIDTIHAYDKKHN